MTKRSDFFHGLVGSRDRPRTSKRGIFSQKRPGKKGRCLTEDTAVTLIKGDFKGVLW